MIPKHTPLVTVGIPTFNRAQMLPRAIESVLHQTYNNIEIIISDNYSTDKTYSICKKYANAHKQIRLYRQKTNTGPINNYLFVLKYAKGKYFMWVSDDDTRSPDYIEKVVALLELDPSTVLGVTSAVQFNTTSTYLLNLPFRKHEDSYHATNKFLINPQIISPLFYGIYRTSILRSIGVHHDGRPLYNGTSDILTVLEVLLRGNLVQASGYLMQINDSAHYHDKFDLMKKHVFTKEILNSIKRYLCYPIMFSMDLYYSIIYIFKSIHSLPHKIILTISALRRWMTEHIMFIYNISKGVLLVIWGFIPSS
jgi:glycosyltransferase involved in cell wall biosynthesis